MSDESKVDATLSRPEGLALERKVAGRSMVLLKNDNHTLPLSEDRQEGGGDRTAGGLDAGHRRRMDGGGTIWRTAERAIP